jgi:geranylgeranyl reductase family protein
LYTARLLAEKGLDVRVIDRKARGADGIVCTGIVGRDIFDTFALNKGSVLGDIQSVRMISPSGRAIIYRHPEPFASVVERGVFDAEMARQAADEGATIENDALATDLEVENGAVKISYSTNGEVSRSVSARFAVLATGNRQGLHRRAGLSAPARFVLGAQAEFSIGQEIATSIYVGQSLIPGGFGWAVPTGSGAVKIGLITDRDAAEIFRGFLRVRFPELDAARARKPLALKPIAQGMASRTVANRALAVGEAAGQVKTTTGGGVYYGLLGARLAAETIVECFDKGDFGPDRLSVYERRWKNALRREIAFGLWAHKIYAWLTESQVETLFDLAQTDGIMPLVEREGRFDWQSDLIISLIRKTSAHAFFKALPRKPTFLERILN